MKYGLALILACCALCAQDKPATPSGFQPITNPNDERLKLFGELNTKAEAGDTTALVSLGDYYFNGQFPVVEDMEKAKEAWTKAASLGSSIAANKLQHLLTRSTDSEKVIERTKWFIIASVLRSMSVSGERIYPTMYPGVSVSSFEEAKAQAADFIAKVKVSKPSLNGSSGTAARGPVLRFESLSLFDIHRKNVCSAYLKAASPIYNKGEAASSDEKEAFTVAAAEITRLQSYMKRRPVSLDVGRAGLTRNVDSANMSDCYAKISAAKIATTLPATRAELNEASIFINALGRIMLLPVSFRGY